MKTRNDIIIIKDNIFETIGYIKYNPDVLIDYYTVYLVPVNLIIKPTINTIFLKVKFTGNIIFNKDDSFVSYMKNITILETLSGHQIINILVNEFFTYKYLNGFSISCYYDDEHNFVVKYSCGDIFYFNDNAELHRDNNPAFITCTGYKLWYQNNKLHNKNGPAVEYPNGKKEWFQNNMLHRINGPAIIYPDGIKEWYLNNKLQCIFNPNINLFWNIDKLQNKNNFINCYD